MTTSAASAAQNQNEKPFAAMDGKVSSERSVSWMQPVVDLGELSIL